jgi:hypothetical protein
MILISLALAGCDLFDKVDDITFNGELPVEFIINEGAVSDVPVVYSETEILNALEDDEIEKYKNKIKEIKLTGITYEIINYTGAEQIEFSKGSLKVGPSAKTLVAVPLVVLEETSQTELTDLELDGLNEFANELKGDKQVEVRMEGTLSQTPVSFTLRAKFHVTVTAEVLK